MENLIVNLFMLAGIFYVAGSDTVPGNDMQYLGSKPAKSYHFPWLVTIHREIRRSKEFFGSGSILTEVWVIGSMDSFVRWSQTSFKKPFYLLVDTLYAYSGGVWRMPYYEESEHTPIWYQARKVTEIRMFSDVNTKTAQVDTFAKSVVPQKLNTYKRSPFGLSMSICLFKVGRKSNEKTDEWTWSRVTLPIPILDTQAQSIKAKLEEEVASLEKTPHGLQCFVGGWRLGDKRLVQHEVVYVPLAQCQAIYCAWDRRACQEWPVEGVHVCFKSLKYTDACWLDQGSALYCHGINRTVIAVLTSGPTCGHGGLPGVYTLIHHAVELYEKVSPQKPIVPLSDSELLKYTPPPEQMLMPVYR